MALINKIDKTREPIRGSRYFVERPPIVDYADLDRRMRSGELSLAIEIPAGFARDVQRGGADMSERGFRAPPTLTYLNRVPPYSNHYHDSDEEGDESVDNGPTGGLTWDGRVNGGENQARIPLLAAFEMDEILWELKDHSAGLNIGRWDYIFSCIKKFRANEHFCLADRAQVTMTAPFMRAYALLLVKTCHRRGAPAVERMGEGDLRRAQRRSQRGQVHTPEERGSGGQRVHRGAHVMVEPGKGELLRPAPAAGRVRALERGQVDHRDGRVDRPGLGRGLDRSGG